MLFIENKYTKIYYRIITRAQERVSITGYIEKHHIIPKSLGGSNKKENLVKLTAREHFICHHYTNVNFVVKLQIKEIIFNGTVITAN